MASSNLWLYGPEFRQDKNDRASHLVTVKYSDIKQTQFIIAGTSVFLTDEQVAELICHLLDLPYDKN